MEPTEIQARAMTNGEVKLLAEAGLDPDTLSGSGEPAAKFAMKAIRWILENVYKETNFDDMPFPVCAKLTAETYGLTFPENMGGIPAK